MSESVACIENYWISSSVLYFRIKLVVQDWIALRRDVVVGNFD